MSNKVALITGGASGMGLAVAKSLLCQGWNVAIVDYAASGSQIGKDIGATFFQADVSNYDQLGEAFEQTWDTYKRLDFVFANAGIVDRESFYDLKAEAAGPNAYPSKPNLASLTIDLDAVIFTCYLGQHFLRKNAVAGGSILITASSGSFYPCGDNPYYSAAKHGCVGFMRSVAPKLYKNDNIRINSINPCNVMTGLMEESEWLAFPKDTFTPMEKIVEIVWMFLDDKKLYGKAVEIQGDYHAFREHIPWGTPTIEQVTACENQS